MTTNQPTRRHIIGGAASIAALGAGLTSRDARAAAAPALPTSPVALNVVDVAGQLQLTQGAMEAYAKANPKLISKISYSQAPAPELPGKIKAQQAAGRVDIDLVLTGTDGLSAGHRPEALGAAGHRLRRRLPDLKRDLPARAR